MSHAVLTGPIRGRVTLADGTEVDVREAVVTVESPEQAAEVAHLIGQRYEAQGHPDFYDEVHDFVAEVAPEFTDYEAHPDEAARIERAQRRDPELAERVAAVKSETLEG